MSEDKGEPLKKSVRRKRLLIAAGLSASAALVGGIVSAVFAMGPNLETQPKKIAAVQSSHVETPQTPAPQPAQAAPKPTSPKPQPKPTPQPTPQYVANPLSITMIVNKKFQLRPTFAPPDLVTVHVPRVANEPLRESAAAALVKLFDGATKDGVNLVMNSGYRSYATQKMLYDRDVASRGLATANEFSAKPGHSEHQSGLAADVAQGTQPSKVNAAGWISAHAHEYGFVVRYRSGKEAITGYHAEPWHIRYVGVPLATTLFTTNKTMEEHFGVPGGNY